MAKIGTAHIELKPVLNDEALDAIVDRIAEAVAEGVRRGIKSAQLAGSTVVVNNGDPKDYADFAEEIQRRANRAPKKPDAD